MTLGLLNDDRHRVQYCAHDITVANTAYLVPSVNTNFITIIKLQLRTVARTENDILVN